MATFQKTLTIDDTQIPVLATYYNYPEQVVDTTKLDANGNVPMVPEVDASGAPVYQTDIDGNFVLDAAGNKIQAMVPENVYIPNPQTQAQFLSDKFDVYASTFFKTALLAVAKAQADAAIKTASDQIDTSLASSVQTVIS